MRLVHTARGAIGTATDRLGRACATLDRSLAVVMVLMLLTRPAAAQLARDSSTDWLASGGSEGERYLRTLQVIGATPLTQWSIRPFSGRELSRLAPHDSAHPWSGRMEVRPPKRFSARFIAPEAGVIVNSTFPYGLNDGPVWAGRGVTGVASAGVHVLLGPAEITLAPQIFRAQNAHFPLAPTGFTGAQAFVDPVWPIRIDLPQRFGDDAYGRIDPGQSTVQLLISRLTVGASTANEAWGPAIENPFLLGNNAAGFPHLFLGTDRPLSIGPLDLGVRIIAGRLDQSDYAPITPFTKRSLGGFIVVAGIRQLPGLELGASRLFEDFWPDSGETVGRVLSRLLTNPFKQGRARAVGNGGDEPDNQLASVFGRWVFPASGVEVYGELGREDNAYDLRDLIVEPDHDLSYTMGLQRVWRRAGGALMTLRGEVMNSAMSHLAAVRSQSPPYVHTPVRQGHTQLGQVLGAPAGFGGGATVVAIDWLDQAGRRTITWRRMLREPGQSPPSDTARKDVLQSVTADWLVFRKRFDVAPEIGAVYNLNRNGGGDAFNVRMAVTARAHW